MLARLSARSALVARALVALVAVAMTGCGRQPERDGSKDESASKVAAPAPAVDFFVELGATEALYTWVDGEGRFQLTEDPMTIPEQSRTAVRVAVSGRAPGTESHVYVVDLAGKAPGDRLTPRAMTRTEWEAKGLAYRAKVVGPLEEREKSAEPPKVAPGEATVIIYGADWCRPCHQAEEYLKEKGIPAVKKDIEEDPLAASEMREKLRRAGLGGSSIPILDVGGTMLIGFSPAAIDRALSKLSLQPEAGADDDE